MDMLTFLGSFTIEAMYEYNRSTQVKCLRVSPEKCVGTTETAIRADRLLNRQRSRSREAEVDATFKLLVDG
jgi:hypothetical protein